MTAFNLIKSPGGTAMAVLLATAALAATGPVEARVRKAVTEMAQPAVKAEETAPPLVVAIPQPLPLPGQLKPLPMPKRGGASDPQSRIGVANAAARVQPVRDGFINAIQQYPYADGALYQVYTAPGQVTDIALQEGEQLVGAGPVAAGDTVRWIIGDTQSGSGPLQRVHILVKPTRSGLVTNLIINTDRRTYHLELRSTPATYLASLSWIYPQDELIALRGQAADAQAMAPVSSGIDVGALEFGYRIEGDKPRWRPTRVFDDGRQVFIAFPGSIAQGDMPPLFVIGASGAGELVNYRVRGAYMVVDRLFAAAELRFGAGRNQKRVRISRTDGRPAS